MRDAEARRPTGGSRRGGAVVAFVAALVAATGPAPLAASTTSGPVTVATVPSPAASSISPTSARAVTDVPILLVPGWFDTERDLAALRIRFVAAGWAPASVRALSFRDPTGGNVEHAREIAVAVDALLAATGAPVVDIVAHSMGGLATRVYVGEGGKVRRVVFLATPHRGTWAAYVAWGEGADEMRPGSPFLVTLNADRRRLARVDALTIRTPVDTHILPGESATLDGVPDRVVCCPSHAGLLRDVEVFRLVRRFLADGVVAEEDR